MDCTVHGILQARIREWVMIPSLGDLPNQGIEPRSPALQADSLLAELPGKTLNTARSFSKHCFIKQNIQLCRCFDYNSLGWEDPFQVGKGNPLGYSCLGNPMDRGIYWAIQSMESQKSRS